VPPLILTFSPGGGEGTVLHRVRGQSLFGWLSPGSHALRTRAGMTKRDVPYSAGISGLARLPCWEIPARGRTGGLGREYGDRSGASLRTRAGNTATGLQGPPQPYSPRTRGSLSCLQPLRRVPRPRLRGDRPHLLPEGDETRPCAQGIPACAGNTATVPGSPCEAMSAPPHSPPARGQPSPSPGGR
jgi:hypothetical protein